MDPDENLKEQREIAARLLSWGGDDALDGWIKAGGFLPKGWAR